MLRILVVDDEMLIRVGIKTMIDQLDGYECIGEASNGKRALELMETCQPDMIITDIRMPEMDGIELIRRLRHMKSDACIVVLSNYNDFELVKEAMKQGAGDYLLKLQMTQESLKAVLDELGKGLVRKSEGKSSSQPIKVLLSDVLSQTFEISESTEYFEVQTSGDHAYVVSLCIQGMGPEMKTAESAMEYITENLWNEEFDAWCMKIGEKEYVIVVMGTYEHADAFLQALYEMGDRYLKALDELLNCQASLYIGSIETRPGRIAASLQNALALRRVSGGNRGRMNAYDDGSAKLTAAEEVMEEGQGENWHKVIQAFRMTEQMTQCPHAIQLAVDYLKKYYNRDVTLQETANLVNLNPSYFSSMFNSVLNITFSNYLMCLRINKAKILLKQTNFKIFEIAESVGYKNSYYFNRIFKKICGVTPTEYRSSKQKLLK